MLFIVVNHIFSIVTPDCECRFEFTTFNNVLINDYNTRLFILFSDLERHERNPCNKWGRYSSSPSSLVCDFSNPPEKE